MFDFWIKVRKFNRESERIKMEYSDQQLKMEAGFNQIRQDLENDQVNGVVTSPPEPPCYPYPTVTGSPSTTSNGNQTNVEENDNNYNWPFISNNCSNSLSKSSNHPLFCIVTFMHYFKLCIFWENQPSCVNYNFDHSPIFPKKKHFKLFLQDLARGYWKVKK